MQEPTTPPIHLGPVTVTFFVESEQSNGSITIERCDVVGGGGIPLAHSHDAFEETIYGLEGVITFTVDGVPHDVEPGEMLVIKRGQVHSFMANGDDASFLGIATPGVFGPTYFLELQAVVRNAAGGPPDKAEIAAVMLRHGLTPVPAGVAAAV